MRSRGSRILALAAMVAAAAASMPAYAQDDAALDALLDGSSTPAQALSLARKQSAEGDLLGAAATLERALMTHSKNDAAVRLYYATVLCTLGDRQTALTEIARTGRVDANSPAWAETRAACGDIALPASESTSINGEFSLGLAYDSDLARSLLVEYALPGYPLVPSADGFSYTSSLRLGFRTPQRGVFFYGGANAALRNAFEGSGPSYQVGDIELGLGTRRGDTEVSLGGVLRHARAGGDPFVTEIGGEAEIAFGESASRFSVRGELVSQDFMGSTASFSRDGLRYDVGLNYVGRSGTTRYWLGGAFELKDADTHRTGYAGGRIGASVRQQIDTGGVYATAATTLRYVEYNDEVGFAPVNETRFFGRAALGVPIGIEGLDVEAAGSYSSRSYNASSTLRNYDNVGAELRLVWTFGN